MATTATKSAKAKSATASKSASKSKVTTAKLTPKSPAMAAKADPSQEAASKLVEAPKPVTLGPQMRKKELVDTVVSQSGMKKKDVKPVVEATLAVLGQALADNRELNLQPFGRMKIRKERDLPNGRVVVAKVRQTQPPETPKPSSKEAAGK